MTATPTLWDMPTFEFPDDLQQDGQGERVPPSVEEPPPPSRRKHTGGVVEMPVESGQTSRRITVHLDDKGGIIWDKLKASNIAPFKAALKQDSTVENLFSKDNIELLTLETATTLVDAVGKINTFVFMKAFKLHPAIAMQYFAYTKEQHERIDPRAQSVLNKYRDKLPAWMTKYQEEFQLGAILVQVTREQLAAALIAQRELVIRLQDNEKQQPPFKANGGDRVVDEI